MATGLFLLGYLLYILRLRYVGQKLLTHYGAFIWKLIIRVLYFSLIIIALLGPSFGEASREVKSVGKDIFIAVDLSESMNAHDIQPTRLEKIKFELKKLISAFESDRIGLIIFSSEAFMQCPLTYDQNALNMFIDILHTGLVPNAGTDFGPPLNMALEKLNSEESKVNQQKSKVILMISDGEDFGDKTEEAVEKIVDADIRLFALGVGTEKGSKIRTASGFKKDRNNTDVITKLESKSLQNLADDTDGNYFEINTSDNDLERLINTINNIEGEIRDVKQVDVASNKYFYFLLVAIGLITIDALFYFKVIRI